MLNQKPRCSSLYKKIYLDLAQLNVTLLVAMTAIMKKAKQFCEGEGNLNLDC